MSLSRRNRFQEKIQSKEFVISVEINPVKNADFTRNFREVALFAPFVDIVNITDSSMARMTPASFVVASLIQQKFDIDTIFNFTCRDRNVIAIKSDLLGALALGVQNVLALTGDPPQHGDHKQAKGVYEFSSSGLIKLISTLKCATGKFFTGGVVNFSASEKNMERIVKMKKDAGAQYLISQPVYTPQRVRLLAHLQKEFNIPILAGILPIKNKRTAQYMQEKVNGITIPEKDFSKILTLPDDEVLQCQTEKAKQIFETAKEEGLSGVHFMPLGRGDKIPEIIGYDPETARTLFYKTSVSSFDSQEKNRIETVV
jgi:5,10-methylenetetrahydrofolate reductase